jgi:hypothetical protein
MSRRGFLAAAGAMAAAAQTNLLDFTSSLLAAEPKSTKKPRVRTVFIRQNIDKYWMGWPGASYDIKARQKEYTKILTDAVKKLNINLQITHEPLHTDKLVSAFLKEVKENPPDGLIVVNMCLHHSGYSAWNQTNNIAKNRGDIPTIVFSPMGTSFTPRCLCCCNTGSGLACLRYENVQHYPRNEEYAPLYYRRQQNL